MRVFRLAVAAVALAAGAATTAVSAPFSPTVSDQADVATTAIRRDWSGFYAGLNMGGAFDSFANTDSIFWGTNIPIRLRDMGGVLGGGQLGYAWKTAALVYGFEADFQGSSLGGKDSFAGDRVYGDLSWFGTVRGRLGYVVGDVLPYFAAGLVYGQVHARFAPAPGAVGPPGGSKIALDVGWTLGGGIEYALSSRWSVHAEYEFLGLPTEPIAIPGTNRYPAPYHFDAGVHLVRLGLNYKFW
jgi:outer membrane immunogenic protein